MTFKLDYNKFSEAFNKIPIQAARELRKQMQDTTKAIVTDAKMHHRFKRKGGFLEKSIQKLIHPSGLSATVFLNEGVASYGKYVHDGTGIYNGGKPYPIKPKNKKLLYFVSKKIGHLISSKGVMHNGIKPDRFLYEAGKRQEPYFIARINGAVKRIIEAAGLK